MNIRMIIETTLFKYGLEPKRKAVDAILALVQKEIDKAIPKNHKETTGYSSDGCGGCAECGKSIGWDMCLNELRTNLQKSGLLAKGKI